MTYDINEARGAPARQVTPGQLLGRACRGSVLLVQGENDKNRSLSIRLVKEGFSVVSAHDGLDGLDRYLFGKPDVVLFELSFPRLNGVAMLERLRGIAGVQAAPVVVLTRDAHESFADEARAWGVVKVFEQPATQQELVSEIDRILTDARP